ncbi:MAG: hypothetical protein KAQ95_06460 [Candidatus Heimdallarchaeota archaeon]|nr:hypothetical protein [Candidatus Heimdallarchaeota archaeon]
MEIKIHKCYDTKAETEVEPVSWIQGQLGSVNSVIKYLAEFKPEIVEDYIQHLIKRVKNAIDSIEKKGGYYDFEIKEKFEFLDKYPDLRKLTQKFLLAHANPMKKSPNDPEKYLAYGYNHSMAFRRISYHRVKTFAELLGKEEGVKLYTKILNRMIEDAKEKNPPKSDISNTKYCEKAIKSWCEYGMADFTSCVLDKHKTVFRFDSCFAHEVLKDFNDPDIAYYASCYGADLPVFNEGRIIHVRRAQTLHHADFCDELYWDARVHDNPEQPSLEFTKKIGRENK